jgi:hypothetical protein
VIVLFRPPEHDRDRLTMIDKSRFGGCGVGSVADFAIGVADFSLIKSVDRYERKSFDEFSSI